MAESYILTVNGVKRETPEDKLLLRYLRDDLHIHSAKDGCSEGACGTCTVLVDGKAIRACILSTKKAAGKSIVTVEGLPENEQEAFVYAFGKVGAVQCGFCIPGMVMSGAGLIHQEPNPTEEQIKKAIRGNVCRCTGYKKIIEGISLAAAILRGEEKMDDIERGEVYGVGQRAFRIDVRDKVLGSGEYCDDVEMEGMAHASAVRSEYPRAKVLDIDASAALALPGVLAVLTAEDVPHNKVGHIQQDWDVMIAKGDITRCVGDALCLVVAESEKILKEAKSLAKIEYEPLEPVRNVREAMGSDAPKVHSAGNLCQSRHVTRGDAKTALANSKYTVTQTYRTPFTEHAFLEPECAVAFPYDDCVRMAAKEASETDHGVVVQDTAWEGYEEIPSWIMQGYGTMANEAASQLRQLEIGRPTHVFVQAGVGSLAGAVVGYFANLFKSDPPKFIVMEAGAADCLYQGAKAGDGEPRNVAGDLQTIMAGLACGEPNIISWDILKNHVDAFISCPDWVSAKGMRMLAAPVKGDPAVCSGESGAVGMGVISTIMADDAYKELREALELGRDSKVLMFSTEGDTDPDKYKQIVWGGEYPTV